VTVSVAGRIASKRDSSKHLIFYDLNGEGTKLQVRACVRSFVLCHACVRFVLMRASVTMHGASNITFVFSFVFVPPYVTTNNVLGL
jgi:hypothetical protein